MKKKQIKENSRLAVEAGAALLDRKHKKWAEEIDLEIFDLDSNLDCIIGQLFGNIFGCWPGLKTLMKKTQWGKKDRHMFAVKHGFMENYNVTSLDDLEKYWIKAVKERKKAAKLPVKEAAKAPVKEKKTPHIVMKKSKVTLEEAVKSPMRKAVKK